MTTKMMSMMTMIKQLFYKELLISKKKMLLPEASPPLMARKVN
jgi:hypothetical protein